MNQLKCKAYGLRRQVLELVMAGKCGHIGGDMSVLEILMAIYDRMKLSPECENDPERDRMILSKGHSVEALYAVLADKGFLDIQEVLRTYCTFGSKYIGHPTNKVPGIEVNSGSLGHGLAVSVGMALAGKMDGASYRVYTVMGDGELAEGSIWEAAMAAGHYRLDNLCAVVDRNGLQISGNTEEVMAQENIGNRFASFGWRVLEVRNGNDIDELQAALDEAERTKGKPTMLVAHTVKGYGSGVMENKAAWHHRVPDRDEYEQILADFKEREERLCHE